MIGAQSGGGPSSRKGRSWLEGASNTNTITQLTALLHHNPLLDDVRDVLTRAGVPGQSLNAGEIKLVVAALMGALLQRNFQRLGAAA